MEYIQDFHVKVYVNDLFVDIEKFFVACDDDNDP